MFTVTLAARAAARLSLPVLLAALGAFALVAPAQAHEHRTIGDYELTVGWTGEPAFEGEKNGIDFRVMNVAGAAPHDDEAEASAGHQAGAEEEATVEPVPVEGLEETVQVEITYNDTGDRVTMPLRAVFNGPGKYTADLFPTAAGHYTFRFFGTIEGTTIDETFDSSEGGFSEIRAVDESQFPVKVASPRELEAAIQGLSTSTEDSAEVASSSDDTARTIGYVGIALGVVGIVVGGAGFAAARRR